jgi:phage protein D
MIPGDYAVVDSWKYPERKGTYLIKSVTTEVSVDSGGKQTIELERRIL